MRLAEGHAGVQWTDVAPVYCIDRLSDFRWTGKSIPQEEQKKICRWAWNQDKQILILVLKNKRKRLRRETAMQEEQENTLLNIFENDQIRGVWDCMRLRIRDGKNGSLPPYNGMYENLPRLLSLNGNSK